MWLKISFKFYFNKFALYIRKKRDKTITWQDTQCIQLIIIQPPETVHTIRYPIFKFYNKFREISAHYYNKFALYETLCSLKAQSKQHEDLTPGITIS